MTQLTILIVDDEPAIVRALSTVLTAHGYQTLEAQSGQRAIARVASHTPNLMILDLGLPDIDGLEVITHVRSFNAIMPILVLSAHGDDHSKVAALDAGADDYVAKPFSMPELLARVRTALRHGDRAAPLEASRIERGDIAIDLVEHRAYCNTALLPLTRTQYDLLVCFCRHPNRVLTHRMLLAEVWDDPTATGTANVRMFVSQLRRQISTTAGHANHIITEPSIGYRFIPQPVDAERGRDRHTGEV